MTLMYESQVFGLCFSTEDQKEGMGAFSKKREIKPLPKISK